ncbi:MAG: NAD-dependent deacylase [Candidatus Cloacimonetes bacterium]|nr:NAD-dependent deacylase [Candidatus Cloacimonadota bacterium]
MNLDLPIRIDDYKSIVFFTGAGMSAESGIWTYRGKGGLWSEYNWQEYACQRAFKLDPEKVLKFHEMRREKIIDCVPHKGHYLISKLEEQHNITIITQNIDGMHQKAGSRNVIELHGSHWHLRCPKHGLREDFGKKYRSYKCEMCGSWLRPDIIWFEDCLEERIINDAIETVLRADLFISIGTSAVVWPAAGMPRYAKQNNALCIEINPEETEMSALYDLTIREAASSGLITLFGNTNERIL